MSASDGSDILLHERIFAQVLGVEENEEFATELTYYAADLLQVLPPGWIVEIGEGELAGIPLFVFTDTEETEWSHPYESEYRRRIMTRRKELQSNRMPVNDLNTKSESNNDLGNNMSEFNASVFNASSIATDFTENDSQFVFAVVPSVPEAAREHDDEASESPVASDELSDYEILFAQVLGVNLEEKQFLPLAFFAKELLKIVPEGWELLLSRSENNVRVPYFYEQATRSSHWVHPYENQYRDLINKKREDLVAAQVPSPIPTPMSTARSFVSESSMNSVDRISLVEAMFAGALGISPFEEFAAELGDYAKELLLTLPPGWELVIADTGKTTEVFPMFVHRDGANQLEHPLMGEHIQSIEEMRATLLYGVLPSEFSLVEPERGASAEASVEFKQREEARLAEEEASRSVATMKSFEARIAEAEKIATERAAADQRTKAELAEAQTKKEVEDQIKDEEDRRAAAKERVRLAHIAREEAEKAFHEAQQARIEEEEAEAAAEAARVAEKRSEEQRIQDKIDAEKRAVLEKERQLQEELEREAQRLQDIADRIAAEARAEQEAAETAEKERRLAEKLAAEIRAEEEEAAVRGAEEAARRAVQDAIDAELAAKQAIEEEKIRAVEREREAAEAAVREAQEAEERAIAEAAAEAARLVAEEEKRIEHERLEKERREEEARQDALRIAAEQAAAEAAALAAARAAEVLEILTVLVAAMVEEAMASATEKIEALRAVSMIPTVISNVETIIHDGWIMSPPAPSTPTDAAVALWGEDTQTQPETSEEEVEAQRAAEAAAAALTVEIETVIGVLAEESVVDLAPIVAQDAIDALHQEVIDKERAIVEAREAEERDAKERAEKRLAARKAAELAAQEALRKAEEEEAALEEAARVLFRKELEIARQASILSRQSSDRSESGAAPTVAPGTVPTAEDKLEVVDIDDDAEPDMLSVTIPSDGIAFDLPPESPDSARLDSARLSVLSHHGVTAFELEAPAPPMGAFDLMAAQTNAIKLKTQYLDQSKPADKTRLVSKRNSISETEKTITPKNPPGKNVTIDLRTDSSDFEHHGASAGIHLAQSDSDEAETSDSAEHAHRKDWKSKILRPLSKVSPKKEAQRRRRAGTAANTLRNATPGRGDTRKERLWEMKVDETEASRTVARMKWYRLGCYETYEDAVHARKVVQKMVVSDSLGTIIVDPRIDISDFDLTVGLQTQSFDAVQGGKSGKDFAAFPALGLFGALSASRATTASPTSRRGTANPNTSSRTAMSGSSSNNLNLSSRPTTTNITPKNSALLGSTQGSRLGSAQSNFGASQRPATGHSGALPAANDTRELILGRVMRTTEKMAKLRVRKDLGRMQWVLETDDAEVNKITDRHRKKKGVDIEGKVENVMAHKAKKALRAIVAARENNDDLATQTLKKLPAMEELLESNLMEVLSTSKSFGGFSLTSKIVANERQLKEEINARVGAIKNKMAQNEKKERALSRSPSRVVRPSSPHGLSKLVRMDSGAILMNNIHSSPSAKMSGKSMSTKLPEINRKSLV